MVAYGTRAAKIEISGNYLEKWGGKSASSSLRVKQSKGSIANQLENRSICESRSVESRPARLARSLEMLTQVNQKRSKTGNDCNRSFSKYFD